MIRRFSFEAVNGTAARRCRVPARRCGIRPTAIDPKQTLTNGKATIARLGKARTFAGKSPVKVSGMIFRPRKSAGIGTD